MSKKLTTYPNCKGYAIEKRGKTTIVHCENGYHRREVLKVLKEWYRCELDNSNHIFETEWTKLVAQFVQDWIGHHGFRESMKRFNIVLKVNKPRY